MPKFIRKPVIVEANQYLGGFEFVLLPGVCCDPKCVEGGPHVHTSQDFKVRLERSDWVLPESDGKHFYIVKDKLFRDAYEPLCESATAQT